MKTLPVLLCLGAALATAAFASAEGGGQGSASPWWEIVKQAVNFALLVGILVYFLKKPLASFLKERSEALRKSIEEAARARAEAAGKLAAIESRLSRLDEEIAGMNRRADAEAAVEAKRIAEAAAAEMERIRLQARFAADQEVKKARTDLRREAAELSAQAAVAIVEKTVTPGDQERLVRENIEKIREIVR